MFLLYTARFIFYDYNLKVLGVIRTLIEVQEKIKSHPDLKKRYFLKPDEVILLADGTKIVVNNQWGTLFPRFLEAAKKLYQVTNDSESNTPISRLKITFGNGKVIQEICLEKYFFMKHGRLPEPYEYTAENGLPMYSVFCKLAREAFEEIIRAQFQETQEQSEPALTM